MLKKIIKWLFYGIIISYILFAPYYLNNIFSQKYLENSIEEEWSGVITMWDVPRLTVKGSTFGWIKGRIAEYQKLHPNIHIDLRELHYDDNLNIASAAALSDDHPDIMPLYVENEMIPLDNVVPIHLFQDENNTFTIKNQLLSTVKEGDTIWAVPVYYSINLLIINNELLTDFEIKIPQELNFDDFINLLKEINIKDDKNEIIPFDFYLEKGNHPYMPFLLSDKENIFTDIGVNFYNKHILTGLNKLTLIKDSIDNLPADYGMRNKVDVLNNFFENKTAILAGNLSDINAIIRKQNSGNDLEFTLASYPIGSIGEPIVFANSVESYAMMKTENASKQKSIEQFLAFLIEEESQKSVEILGKLPVVDNYPYIYEQYPHLQELSTPLSLRAIPFYRNRAALEEEIQNQLRNYFNKDQPSTETLFQIEQNINNIINK